MKRILTLTAIALGLSGGVALADRFGGRGRSEIRDHRNDRPMVRNHDRGDNRWGGNDNRWRGNDNRWRGDNRSRVRVERVRPTFRNNRFYFSGGTYRTYNRPVINVRYRDYYRRPALVVENYDAVPGYIWTAGQWNWNGYEWNWIPGHYDVDTSYSDDDYYDQGSYDQGSYDNSYDDSYNRTYVAPSASVSGSVQWGY